MYVGTWISICFETSTLDFTSAPYTDPIFIEIKYQSFFELFG